MLRVPTCRPDGKVVSLSVPTLAPTWGLALEYELEGEKRPEIPR